MNKNIKLLVGSILLAGGIYLLFSGMITWGVISIILAIFTFLVYFINEYIILAFLRLRKQDIEGAKKWMAKIKSPQKQIRKGQLGYYHYMMGITQAQDNLNDAEKNMRKALSYGLMFGHDRAMAKMNIAAGMLRKGNKIEAKRLLKEARSDDKQNMMASQIDLLEEQMKKAQVSRNPRQQQMQRRGRYF